MHIVKPVWLTHPGELKDFEVYSCHVSPDGNRLATAAGDGHVRVWSTEAILNSANPDYKKPRQLAAVSNHSGTIHAVRFSGNGKYLASGADDRVVCVYVLDPNPVSHSTFGSNEEPPVENWRVLRRLIGHDNDVQDLGWSYDSSILVSVGLDSKVVVWSGHTFEKLKTINSHQSHVKGITFDPANKYFATASDDRTIKLFRFTSPAPNATAQDSANNFMHETTITNPFMLSPLTTYFRRCSWSPDGNHIAAANATNGPVSSVAIVNRGSWESDINLIGHEGPVEVCAFSPRMFYREPLTDAHLDANGNSNLPSVTVIACAGQDKTLSIWNTSFARPFVITQELASKSISDLAWSPDGEKLYLTSLDGSIMTAVFEPGELGYVAPLSESDKALQKFGAGRRLGMVEGTDALLLEEGSKAGELKGVQGRMGELMGDGGLPALASANGVASTTQTNGVAAPIPDAQPATTNGQSSAAQAPAAPQSSGDPRVDKLKQRVTVTKDGKKRIAPLLVSASSGLAESSLPQTQLVSAQQTRSGPGGRNDSPHNILDLSKPYDGYPRGGLAGLLLGNKRKFAEIDGDNERRLEKRFANSTRNGAAPILKNTPEGLVPPKTSERPGETEVPEPLRPAIVNPSLSPVIMDCRGWWLLCITAVGQCYVWNVKTLSAPHPPVSVAPILDAAVHSQGPHLLNTPSIVFARLNSEGRIIAALSNGDGYTYSPMLYVWQRLSDPWWAVGSQYWNTTDSSVGNIASGKIEKSKEKDTDEVASENISAGIIPQLERNTTNHTLLRGRAFYLSRLVKALLSAEGFENLESSVSIAHLENRVAAAMTLGAREEFKIYLLMYAKRLGAEGLKGKIEELLRSLMGNIFEDEDDDKDGGKVLGEGEANGSSQGSTNKEELVGWKREELLKEVVVVLGKHRDLQRITVPYARLLGVVEQQRPANEDGEMDTEL
ncbi:hypothetical protein GTA08_BOTSDO03232 [Neofusicoccum parvum]|uniref:Uncharacterized protein n=1 Tax=Neofusicoccum parvum TaxID=310453 RepID=A0ACB5RY74_9PEZI|nr:hypothetical protein GTA08_BOTSDO03232 [Neofusicoccum parvum]GME31509.1 hypothetical protein GTA08_BOTSDO03232 [Neofusicoccum parvum]